MDLDSATRRADDASMTRVLHEAVAELPLAERRITELETSIAAFVGLAPAGPLDRAVRVESFDEFAAVFGDAEQPLLGPYLDGAKLAHAVRGFFANGGRACWVARAAGAPGDAHGDGHLGESKGLRLLAQLDEPTIVAAPDAHGLAGGPADAALVQHELVRFCESVVGRIALLDAPPGLDTDGALAWRSAAHIDSPSAAAYHPWILVSDPASEATTTAVPPCGHAAGMWARVDSGGGPHLAPTAEVVLASDGPVCEVLSGDQRRLNRAGLNCLRAWPGPELRAWGACTISSDPELRYLHRQRIVGHLAASIAHGTRWAGDELDAPRLHERLRTVVSTFLAQAWRDGALKGDAPSQAFFVHCDDELNSAAAKAAGDAVVIEIGLAVRRGGEFRVLRVAHRDLHA